MPKDKNARRKSKAPLSRRSFLRGATAGAVGAGVIHHAAAQEFIHLGSLDDLPNDFFDFPIDDFSGEDGRVPDLPDPEEPPFTPPEPPSIATRQNVHALDPFGREIASLRRGVAAMKARDADDPTSWNYQARIHGFNRGFVQPPLGAPWGTCRHRTGDFISWHRMYLYYFERILRAASGDPTLALPYWNVAVPGQDALPDAFRDPFNNALFEPRRVAAINGGAPINPVVRTMAATAMMPTGFGGRVGFNSTLESSLHDFVHVAVGGPGGAMASVILAGEDPIFWLHHCNVDRLWSRWLGLGGGRQNPTNDPAFMNTPFNFADETGQIVTLTGADVLDSAAQAAAPPPPRAPIPIPASRSTLASLRSAPRRAAPAFAAPAIAASAVAPSLRAQALVDGPDAGEPVVEAFDVAETPLAENAGSLTLGGRKTSARLQAVVPPTPVRAAPPAPARAVAPAPPRTFSAPGPAPDPAAEFRTEVGDPEAQPVILQLEEIDFEVPPGIWYEIYVNKPEGIEADLNGPFFGGVFIPFSQSKTDAPTAIDITGLINRQIESGLFNGGEIGVEFVPSQEGDDVPEISIGRVRVLRP